MISPHLLRGEGCMAATAEARWRRGVPLPRFPARPLGTKLLRETGNLKLVHQVLNHSDLKTTSKYSHVLDDEVAAAMERHQGSPKKLPDHQPKGKLRG